MSLKVYLASPYVQKETTTAHAADLEKIGIEVTSTWLKETHPPSVQMADVTPEQHLQYAEADVGDIERADVLIFHNDPTKTVIRAGRHVEFGIAVARRMPIFVVGEEHENVFHHLKLVKHFKTWEDVIAHMKTLAGVWQQ